MWRSEMLGRHKLSATTVTGNQLKRLTIFRCSLDWQSRLARLFLCGILTNTEFNFVHAPRMKMVIVHH